MKLPVLMYHKVSEHETPGRLNVSPKQLEKQFRYLWESGFKPISVQELLDHISSGRQLPAKPVMITFDDGYESQFSNVYPLLLRYNMKAVIFLTAGFIQNANINSQSEYITIENILAMKQENVEYGLHTMEHKSYEELPLEEIEKDIKDLKLFFSLHEIPFVSCLAYTFGAFPRNDKEKRIMLFKLFEKEGIHLAFRIGNRVNVLPFKRKFLIQRIDIRGDDPSWKFKWMIRYGRKWLPI
ncbi:MAG: polysaccharide deacetylase family protein [Bacteroidetes bacterium]|nr:polysaccharide deacetylase family protein [Bacteroidota bacterium]MBS1930148.1 polysaccharide deacetylase family protein [Bacteroidota bacterium]